MALPQEIILDAELSDLAQSSKESEFISAVADWKEAQAQVKPHLDRLENILREIEDKSGKARSLAKEELVDINELIAYVEESEADLRQALLPLLERAQRCERDAFSLPVSRSDRAQAITTWERAIGVLSRALGTFRDFHWELMALRAQTENPGDAPVFDDPEELLKYLDETK